MIDIKAAAFRRYFRDARRSGGVPNQPDHTVDYKTVRGDKYVVLSNCNGELARYRIAYLR